MTNSLRIDRSRRILLVDCDAFYVQVARLEDPEGAGRADLLIVGGSPEGRGVVSSASYEARRYGVRSAMPTAHALRLCPDALVVPVPRAACTARSAEVRAVLERVAPVVEAASIDEFYLDLTGTEAIYPGQSLAEIGESIRKLVLEESGIGVSIGGGTQRVIAKLAVELAKPGGVHIVPAGSEATFMRRFKLAEIPGVGPVMAERLRSRGLEMVDDALPHSEEGLRSWLGDAAGKSLYQKIRGYDPTPVTPRSPARSISREETFPYDIDKDSELEAQLLRLVVRATSELRNGGLIARTITVRVRDMDFRRRQASLTLDEGVRSERVVYQRAVELLSGLRRRRHIPVRLVGVSLSQLEAEGIGSEQLGLFDQGAGAGEGIADRRLETSRDRELSRAVDRLRARFGTEAIVPAGLIDRRTRSSRTSSRREEE